MKVEVIRAWPRRFESTWLELGECATAGDALRAVGAAEHEFAIFGVRGTADTALHEGDRIELLRPLQADPKQARRRRAQVQRGG